MSAEFRKPRSADVVFPPINRNTLNLATKPKGFVHPDHLVKVDEDVRIQRIHKVRHAAALQAASLAEQAVAELPDVSLESCVSACGSLSTQEPTPVHQRDEQDTHTYTVLSGLYALLSSAPDLAVFDVESPQASPAAYAGTTPASPGPLPRSPTGESSSQALALAGLADWLESLSSPAPPCPAQSIAPSSAQAHALCVARARPLARLLRACVFANAGEAELRSASDVQDSGGPVAPACLERAGVSTAVHSGGGGSGDAEASVAVSSIVFLTEPASAFPLSGSAASAALQVACVPRGAVAVGELGPASPLPVTAAPSPEHTHTRLRTWRAVARTLHSRVQALEQSQALAQGEAHAWRVRFQEASAQLERVAADRAEIEQLRRVWHEAMAERETARHRCAVLARERVALETRAEELSHRLEEMRKQRDALQVEVVSRTREHEVMRAASVNTLLAAEEVSRGGVTARQVALVSEALQRELAKNDELTRRLAVARREHETLLATVERVGVDKRRWEAAAQEQAAQHARLQAQLEEVVRPYTPRPQWRALALEYAGAGCCESLYAAEGGDCDAFDAWLRAQEAVVGAGTLCPPLVPLHPLPPAPAIVRTQLRMRQSADGSGDAGQPHPSAASALGATQAVYGRAIDAFNAARAHADASGAPDSVTASAAATAATAGSSHTSVGAASLIMNETPEARAPLAPSAIHAPVAHTPVDAPIVGSAEQLPAALPLPPAAAHAALPTVAASTLLPALRPASTHPEEGAAGLAGGLTATGALRAPRSSVDRVRHVLWLLHCHSARQQALEAQLRDTARAHEHLQQRHAVALQALARRESEACVSTHAEQLVVGVDVPLATPLRRTIYVSLSLHAPHHIPIGTARDVPEFLRASTRIRRRAMSRKDAESLVTDLWQEKRAHDARKGVLDMPLCTFLGQYLRAKLGLQALVAECGYNLLDALVRHQRQGNGVCRMTLLVLTGRAPEESMYEQDAMVAGLEALLRALDTLREHVVAYVPPAHCTDTSGVVAALERFAAGTAGENPSPAGAAATEAAAAAGAASSTEEAVAVAGRRSDDDGAEKPFSAMSAAGSAGAEAACASASPLAANLHADLPADGESTDPGAASVAASPAPARSATPATPAPPAPDLATSAAPPTTPSPAAVARRAASKRLPLWLLAYWLFLFFPHKPLHRLAQLVCTVAHIFAQAPETQSDFDRLLKYSRDGGLLAVVRGQDAEEEAEYLGVLERALVVQLRAMRDEGVPDIICLDANNAKVPDNTAPGGPGDVVASLSAIQSAWLRADPASSVALVAREFAHVFGAQHADARLASVRALMHGVREGGRSVRPRCWMPNLPARVALWLRRRDDALLWDHISEEGLDSEALKALLCRRGDDASVRSEGKGKGRGRGAGGLTAPPRKLPREGESAEEEEVAWDMVPLEDGDGGLGAGVIPASKERSSHYGVAPIIELVLDESRNL